MDGGVGPHRAGMDEESATAAACELARKAVACRGIGRDDFLADEKTRLAVLHKFLVLGEAAKRISPASASGHAEVPWRLIAGLRDRLIHGSDAVDIEEVWIVVQRKLPALLGNLEPLLPRER